MTNMLPSQDYNYKTGRDICQLESMIKQLDSQDHTQFMKRKWRTIVSKNTSIMRPKSRDNKISLTLSKT